MLSLSNDLFDRMRSYLNFKQLHAARRVSKRWSNISQVSKSLILDDIVPAPNAIYSRVEKLEVLFLDDRLDRYDCIIRVLTQSSVNLKSIRFFGAPPRSVLQHVPILPNLTTLFLALGNAEVAETFTLNAPNLTSLELSFGYWEPQRLNFDFKKLKALERIHLAGKVIGDVSNIDHCNLQEIVLQINEDGQFDFYDYWNDCFLRSLQSARLVFTRDRFDFGAYCVQNDQFTNTIKTWFQKKPDLRLESKFKLFEGQEKIEFSIEKGKVIIEECSAMERTIQQIGQIIDEFVQVLDTWKQILPFELEINPEIEAEKKRNLFLLLTCSKCFSMSQLSEILLKANA